MDQVTEPPGRSPLGSALMALSVALVVGLLGLLVYRVAQGNPGKGLVSAIRKHEKPAAPNFELKVLAARKAETWTGAPRASLADGRVSLQELRGTPVVLNFWASWCIPCAREAPRLNASAEAHRGEVVFLGIDVKDFSSDARAFLRKHAVNYVSVRDGGGGVYDDYGLTGLPETYFVDRQGRIVAHVLGEISRAQIVDGLEAAVASR